MTTKDSTFNGWVSWCLRNKLVVILIIIAFTIQGIVHAPFDWSVPVLGSDPVRVDALPDIADNQQIVFTEWPGYSPEDVDEQITYPLTLALRGLPSVKAMRSASMFGFSTITIIFNDDVDFYWARSRLLEKLSSLSSQTLPPNVVPRMGPDATGLGQILWYTLEGRDETGQRLNLWDLEELRHIQDWDAALRLQTVSGVAEVSSIGGFEREYQIEVDPQKMQAAQINILQIMEAVQASNRDVGARSVEQNGVEYVIRSRGLVKDLNDLQSIVLNVVDNVPLTLGEIAEIQLGPALRRGALDKSGVEAVGGVVVVQQKADPFQVTREIKQRIEQINKTGLAQRTAADGRIATLQIIPFYDRSVLIEETVGTLENALAAQVIISIIVVVLMMRVGSGVLISSLLPIAVLISFVFMKSLGIEANILALSGIAIAIGTVVDMGVVVCENIVSEIHDHPDRSIFENVRNSCAEVASAVLTAVSTTIVGFVPVFFLAGEAGRMFGPLAATKTIILALSVSLALSALPILAYVFFQKRLGNRANSILRVVVCAVLMVCLSILWAPFGIESDFSNLLFTVLMVLGVVFAFLALRIYYERLLAWCLAHKILFLSLPCSTVICAAIAIPYLGEEPMPALDEGSYLLMPTMSYHGSIGEALTILSQQDAEIAAIPEIDMVVGKIGRVNSALDPAPVGMIETIIQYKPEYIETESGLKRQWREHIKSPQDIWDEISKAAMVPGVTGAPKLQPIETRRIMLQTGIRSQFGLKALANSSEASAELALQLERWLRQQDSVSAPTVVADRVVAKPYVEILPDRQRMARHGISMKRIQDVIEVSLGGKVISQVLDKNARYGIRVRYVRDQRQHLDQLNEIYVPSPLGYNVLLNQVADIHMQPGPQVLKREGTNLVAYVTFAAAKEIAAVDFVSGLYRQLHQDIVSGSFVLPQGSQVEFSLDGKTLERYKQENAQHLRVFVFSGLVIALILFLQFRHILLTVFVASNIIVAMSGAVLLIVIYNQGWLWQSPLLVHIGQLFNVGTINISTAVLVGFIALFGIATDDAVVMATYLRQRFAGTSLTTVSEIRQACVEAAKRRIRPCLMTSATTIVSLLPVLSSTGRGSDVMRPMAVPVVGGMVLVLVAVFMMPVLYAWYQESLLKKK